MPFVVVVASVVGVFGRSSCFKPCRGIKLTEHFLIQSGTGFI